MTFVPLTAGDVAAAVRGQIVSGGISAPIGRISIDSRGVAPGDFFVAIRGERFDGHHFVAAALAAGAGGALLDNVAGGGSLPPDAVIVRSADTTAGLQDLARHVRRASQARVVAITGSAGKTTTKEACAELLSTRHQVFRNKGNLNNHIGLPLSLLELRAGADVAVVELGMNHAGEIRTLVGIAEPEVRVWTNVGDAHIGFFASVDAIADAKAEILEGASGGDVLIANADDPRIMSRAQHFAGRTVTFGVHSGADVQASQVRMRGLDGFSASVRTPAGALQLDTSLLGTGNLSNVLAATAVAVTFDVPLDAIAARVSALRPARRRGELLRLPGGVTLIDDSYNSSPSALKRSLAVVAAATGSARKVAVLGEMLELGEYGALLHRECGQAAKDAGLDCLYVVGGAAAGELADAARKAGMPAGSIVVVSNREEALTELLKRVRPGDLVLVKGSRGIGLDVVVDRLKAEFA